MKIQNIKYKLMCTIKMFTLAGRGGSEITAITVLCNNKYSQIYYNIIAIRSVLFYHLLINGTITFLFKKNSLMTNLNIFRTKFEFKNNYVICYHFNQDI